MMEVVDEEDYEKLLSHKKIEDSVKDEPLTISKLTESEGSLDEKKDVEDQNDDKGKRFL